MRSSCEDIQIAIEMGRHDALDADGQARVDEHLHTCHTCQRYAALGQHSEDLMNAITAHASQQIDWQKLRHGVDQAMGRLRRATLATPVVALALTAFAVWAFPDMWRFYIVVMPLAAGAISALIIRKNLLLRREARAAGQVEGDLLAFWRRHLERTYRGLAFTGGMMGMASLIWLVPHISGLLADEPWREAVYYIVIGTWFLGYGLYAFLVARPRIRTQLEELR